MRVEDRNAAPTPCCCCAGRAPASAALSSSPASLATAPCLPAVDCHASSSCDTTASPVFTNFAMLAVDARSTGPMRSHHVSRLLTDSITLLYLSILRLESLNSDQEVITEVKAVSMATPGPSAWRASTEQAAVTTSIATRSSKRSRCRQGIRLSYHSIIGSSRIATYSSACTGEKWSLPSAPASTLPAALCPCLNTLSGYFLCSADNRSSAPDDIPLRHATSASPSICSALSRSGLLLSESKGSTRQRYCQVMDSSDPAKERSCRHLALALRKASNEMRKVAPTVR
eukprot:2202190-Rhodomonas_salina.1